jgi:hypothetical protein
MPPLKPKILDPQAIREIGLQLADYSQRCALWSAQMEKAGIAEVIVEYYKSWPAAMSNLVRFFGSLEKVSLRELERRGIYHAEGPDEGQ